MPYIILIILFLSLPFGMANADGFGAMFMHSAPTALEDTKENVFVDQSYDDDIMPYDIEPAAGVETDAEIGGGDAPRNPLTYIVRPSNNMIKTIMPEAIK